MQNDNLVVEKNVEYELEKIEAYIKSQHYLVEHAWTNPYCLISI